jgi:hypothetical protein
VIPREGVESKRRLVGLLDVEQVIPREGVESLKEARAEFFKLFTCP